MALVLGEDSESDEEINTEQLHSIVLTPDGSLKGYQGLMKNSAQQKSAGIVMGEDCETDEEEEEKEGIKDSSDDHTDSGSVQGVPSSAGQTGLAGAQQPQEPEAQEPAVAIPPSLLHKKLREKNQSLRRNVVDRILKLYSITCRNLTLVNNNLSKAQGTIEMVNSNLKRSEHELSDLNSILRDVNLDARSLAPYLSSEQLAKPKKMPPSPITHKILKGFSSWGAAAGAMSTSRSSSSESVPEAKPGIPEAHPGIPEAQPGIPEARPPPSESVGGEDS